MIIKTFNEIRKADIATAGGKGASLGEMTQAGIPVPDGFVVLVDAFDRFLEKTDLIVEVDTILHSVKKRKCTRLSMPLKKSSNSF
jgi:pyruvate,water dikinase